MVIVEKTVDAEMTVVAEMAEEMVADVTVAEKTSVADMTAEFAVAVAEAEHLLLMLDLAWTEH